MTALALTSDAVFRWLSFERDGEQITRLRRRVFGEEQGLGADMVQTPRDARGLHLGLLDRGELVSCVSANVYEDEPEVLQKLGLPYTRGRVVQFTKRAELPSYRGSGTAALLAGAMCHSVLQTLRPDYVFLTLLKEHEQLVSHYRNVYGFQVQQVLEPSRGNLTVMLSHGTAALRATYLKARKVLDEQRGTLGIKVPSLVRHLEQSGRLGLIPMQRFTDDNLYTAPLSLKDELPRLSAQTRLIHLEQRGRLEQVAFPSAPARLMDLGAGPGVYLSALSKEPQFKGYQFTGLDQSPQMVAYGRMNRPDFRWVRASAYATGEPDASYDVVHSNFVFIHLQSPDLGLREVRRLLKPGGLLYVVDVNDATFQGPPEVARMIEAHHDLYEGDRSVLRVLPDLAEEFGFKTRHNFVTTARNTASGEAPELAPDELRIARILMWGLFAFIGQREELADLYQTAREHYLRTNCEISIGLQTLVLERQG